MFSNGQIRNQISSGGSKVFDDDITNFPEKAFYSKQMVAIKALDCDYEQEYINKPK